MGPPGTLSSENMELSQQIEDRSQSKYANLTYLFELKEKQGKEGINGNVHIYIPYSFEEKL